MANNGFMVGESCVSGEEKAYQVCSLQYGSRATGANYIFYQSKGTKSFQCHLVSPVEYPVISNLVTPNCEIPGPALTEIQQIEAINALFPAAVAILATAWAFKYLRNMIYEFLKERNQND